MAEVLACATPDAKLRMRKYFACVAGGIETACLILETPAPMLKIFKKLLGKSDAPVAPTPKVAATPAARPAPADNLPPMPQVEVAHLSLAAIVQKLPEDLRGTVTRMPDASVTVALPVATIQKQLPSGSVKMSLASLYRQAPAGTFSQARVEDRRMVEVPLSEVFRHVSPTVLPRREQRRVDLPEDAVGLFGDSSNPYALSPGAAEQPARTAAAAPVPQQRIIQPPMEMRTQAAPAQSQPRIPQQPKAAPRAITPPSGLHSPQGTPAAASNEPPLVLPITNLAEGWPEPIRSEALALNGAQVALPAGPVTAGLAKGKVSFSWGQIRAWLNPPPSAPTGAHEATELVLPLKIVAPAFLAHSKPKTPRKSYELDESIPALFSGGQPAAPEPEPTPEPVVEAHATAPEPEPEPEPIPPTPTVIAPPADLQTDVAAPAPASEPEAEPEPQPEPEPEPVIESHAVAPEPEATPEAPAVIAPPAELATEAPAAEATPAAASLPAPAAPGARTQKTLGELLGNPEKTHWSPPELVKATTSLPGVAGAVVGLQEGLLVAAHLPEHMKGDTVAAFLPQIFARLTNYAGEMKLGGVEDILFTSNGAHFQTYRLGEVYFAVLGKPGESLPWEGLRLIVEELAHHHQK